MTKWLLPDNAPAPVRGPRTLPTIDETLVDRLDAKTDEQPEPTSLPIGMFSNYPK